MTNANRDRMLELVQKMHATSPTRNGSLKTPYWLHCQNVAGILEDALGERRDVEPTVVEDLYLAALGHDLYEDTQVERTHVAEVCGPRVHSLILGMTNEVSDQDLAQYLYKLRTASDEVLLIKYADFIDNAQSLAANRKYFTPSKFNSIIDILVAIHPVLDAHEFSAEWQGVAMRLREMLVPAWTALCQ